MIFAILGTISVMYLLNIYFSRVLFSRFYKIAENMKIKRPRKKSGLQYLISSSEAMPHIHILKILWAILFLLHFNSVPNVLLVEYLDSDFAVLESKQII